MRLSTVLAILGVAAISVEAAYTIGGVLSSNAPPVTFALGTTQRNVSYCNSQTLDLYVPASAARRPLPLAVFVHGGGMTGGDKANINPVLLNALASAGYAVASLNYRLAPMSKFPAQIEDVKCAIRFLRDRAAAYGFDRSEIFAFGTSVGGQLVALAALTGPHSVFDVGAYMNESSEVRAVVDMFGPANLTEDSGFSETGVQRVFGFAGTRADLLAASPTHYVSAGAPAIMIVQGIDDAKVPEAQSVELYRDLVAAGNEPRLVLVQNMGHMFVQAGSQPLDPSLQQIGHDMVDFFNGHSAQG